MPLIHYLWESVSFSFMGSMVWYATFLFWLTPRNITKDNKGNVVANSMKLSTTLSLQKKKVETQAQPPYFTSQKQKQASLTRTKSGKQTKPKQTEQRLKGPWWMITEPCLNKPSAYPPIANSTIQRSNTIHRFIFSHKTPSSDLFPKLTAFGSAQTSSLLINNKYCFPPSETVRVLHLNIVFSVIQWLMLEPYDVCFWICGCRRLVQGSLTESG